MGKGFTRAERTAIRSIYRQSFLTGYVQLMFQAAIRFLFLWMCWMSLTVSPYFAIPTAAYLVFVMFPLRTSYTWMLSEYALRRRLDWQYKASFFRECRRLGRGLPWGLPFLAVASFLTVSFTGDLPFTVFGRIIRAPALLFSDAATADTGLICWLVILALSGALFVYGWRKDTPLDYLPMGWTLKDSKAQYAAFEKAWRCCFRGNVLLSLPFAAAALALVAYYAYNRLGDCGSLVDMCQRALAMLREPLQMRLSMMLFGCGMVLYLPLCQLRKLRNAVLAARKVKKEPLRR